VAPSCPNGWSTRTRPGSHGRRAVPGRVSAGQRLQPAVDSSPSVLTSGGCDGEGARGPAPPRCSAWRGDTGRCLSRSVSKASGGAGRQDRMACNRRSLDHPFDHPDDPTGPVWIRPDRRAGQREQIRSVWSRPDRRRAPGYGSDGCKTVAGIQRDPGAVCSVTEGGQRPKLPPLKHGGRLTPHSLTAPVSRPRTRSQAGQAQGGAMSSLRGRCPDPRGRAQATTVVGPMPGQSFTAIHRDGGGGGACVDCSLQDVSDTS
jgi:hypothetical protein